MVLAFVALWLAIFLSWTLYYLVCILRDARDTVRGVKQAADAIESAATHVKDRFGSFMGLVPVVVEGIKVLVEKLGDGKGKRKKE